MKLCKGEKEEEPTIYLESQRANAVRQQLLGSNPATKDLIPRWVKCLVEDIVSNTGLLLQRRAL